MSAASYQGVILAAGHGSRMGALGDVLPKALLPVANVTLLQRHLQTLQALHVTEVFVVIGHLGEQIRDALENQAPTGMTVHFVEQCRREGLAHAVGALEARITQPFILLLGDIYAEYNDVTRLLAPMKDRNAKAVLAVRHETTPEPVCRNFSVTMDDKGRVRKVVEKPKAPECLCKGCGLYAFSPAIFDAIRRTPRSNVRNEFELTDAIQVLIDDGRPVYGVEVVDWDKNITTPEDVIVCNEHILHARGLTQLTGEGCDLAAGTVLQNTVLGHDVHIVQACPLTRCVVLPGTVVDTPTPLKSRVLYPGMPHG